MATDINIAVKDAMLQAIQDWSPGSSGSTIRMGAYSADSSGAALTTTSASYNPPSGGVMSLAANVVLNIPAGSTVTHLRIQKGDYPNDNYIYKKDITSESFTYAGTITITSATMTITG